jgi:hypothetical protein
MLRVSALIHEIGQLWQDADKTPLDPGPGRRDQ